jgi:hypothetical protein
MNAGVAEMKIIGEVRCLACGRYLADAAEVAPATLSLVARGGAERAEVRLRNGRPFCRHCGGRAFVEFDLGHKSVLSSTERETVSVAPDEVAVGSLMAA